jgi:hypothetical protein
MKCSKRVKLVVVGALLAAACLAGSAEATPYISVWRETHVGFNSEWKTDYATQKFSHLNVRAGGSALSSPGTITITPSGAIDFVYTKAGLYSGVILGTGTLTAAAHTFSTFPEASGSGSYRHEVLDTEKGRVQFIGTAAQEGTVTYNVSYTNGAETAFNNNTVINAAPPSGCWPYMELTASGGKLTGLKLRFISNKNNPNSVLNNSGAISHIGDNEIYILNDSGGFDEVPLGFSVNNIASGSPLEWIKSDLNIDLDKVVLVLISFDISASSLVSNGWNFIVNPDLMPKGVEILLPTDDEITAAGSAAKEALGDSSISVGGAKGASLSTNTEIDNLNQAFVSSAIAIRQSVSNQGDAVVLGKVALPLNAKSLDGADIPKLEADSLDDLQNSFSVMKYFPNGGGVDLMELYRKIGKLETLFEYDAGEKMVKFKKMIIVVDNVVPSEADFKSGSCGVKLVGDYLYVFDGTKDGTAQDPIALQAQSAPSSNGGGGGCDAGFGIVGLLLAGLVTLKHRKV